MTGATMSQSVFAKPNEKLSVRNTLIETYLDRFNNYLTDEKYAEHNHLTLEQAKTLLALAKQVFESKHPEE
jgi:hypothetical protein